MNKLLFIIIGSLIVTPSRAQQLGTKEYKTDFQYFWSTIKIQYCYWDKKATDWDEVKRYYSELIDTVKSTRGFIAVLENTLNELYDHHASLNTNTTDSYRLVPSGTDMWAEYINGIPTIIEVRKDFGAATAGIRAGMQITQIDDKPVDAVVKTLAAKHLKKTDVEARNFALRILLAGTHSQTRKITTRFQNRTADFFPDNPVNLLKTHQYEGKLQVKLLKGNIGYIRINNRLWDNSLIQEFDSLLNTLLNTKATILDLRETPGGGNTTVARSIIGRFIKTEGFYQKHELSAEETEYGVKRSWMEIVSPREPVYSRPLVILVNHWTGSVGEGIAIGFHALKRATIIGTEMAQLNGAIDSYSMPNTKIGFSFPVEKLFHVNGTPRENFKPHVRIDMKRQKQGQDLILEEAVKHLSKAGKSNGSK
jgi:C-terminal processing protease CtpA/Prc